MANRFFCVAFKSGKNLSVGEQTEWQTWADTYPQPTLLDPTVSLSAYENFVKRNYYLYMQNPATFSFLLHPVIVNYAEETPDFIVQVSETTLQIVCTFDINNGNWDVLIFLSGSLSAGRNFGNTYWRQVAKQNQI